jgi:hypothetical protein
MVFFLHPLGTIQNGCQDTGRGGLAHTADARKQKAVAEAVFS